MFIRKFILLFLTLPFMAVATCWSQRIVATRNGVQYVAGNLLQDADVCTFRLDDNGMANWLVELGPYTPETCICKADGVREVRLEVTSQWRQVWGNAERISEGDYTYYEGRVSCTDAMGRKDTLALRFCVLPKHPRLLEVQLSDFDVCETMPRLSTCRVYARISIQDTSHLIAAYYESLNQRNPEYLLDYPVEYHATEDTIVCDLGEMFFVDECFEFSAINSYGSTAVSAKYRIADFVEAEEYRKIIDESLGIQEASLPQIEIRQTQNLIVVTAQGHKLQALRLYSLTGSLIAESVESSELTFPSIPSHCTILSIQCDNKIITKKIKL